jgi:endonuclease-3
MDIKTVGKIFATFAKLDPEPKTELEAPNDYCLLVAIVLSAQATDVSVNKATKSLFAKIKTPEQMVKLGEGGLKNHIKTIGLYNAKAKNVIALSERLISEYGSVIPIDRDALQTLPGVGRKTANVWLNCVHGHHTIAVDTHVFRVANRIGLCKTTDPLKTELALEKIIPKKWMQHAHHWLILHGRYICKARKPECFRCPIVRYCEFPGKNAV